MRRTKAVIPTSLQKKQVQIHPNCPVEFIIQISIQNRFLDTMERRRRLCSKILKCRTNHIVTMDKNPASEELK